MYRVVTDPMEKRQFLERILTGYRQNNWPAKGALKQLMALCLDVDPEVREQALTLLMSPPVEGADTHTRWLMTQTPRTLGNSKIPLALLTLFPEVLAFLEGLPDEPLLRRQLVERLPKMPSSGLLWLSRRPLPLRPFLAHLPVASWTWLYGARNQQFKWRWRLFRKLLLGSEPHPSWAQLTLRDLLVLREHRNGRPRSLSRTGRWHVVTRRLMLPPRQPKFPDGDAPVCAKSTAYWNGAGSLTRKYLDALSWQLAEELRSTRQLAVRVSERTRRVVLSLHNATLAACSGWGFEMLRQQFPSASLWSDFVASVHGAVQQTPADMAACNLAIGELWQLWQERLFTPKLLHSLWESKVKACFDPHREHAWRKQLETAASLLDSSTRTDLLQPRHYAWQGPLSPHQHVPMQELIAWQQGKSAHWQQGFRQLPALIREGQKLLDSGRLQYLVLPWIDKFFISSRRDQDLEYLPRILDWLEQNNADPLVVFWEDTARRQGPSLQLALERLSGNSFRYAGIGVFGTGTDTVLRRQAEDFICDRQAAIRLFALRPYADTVNTKSLEQLLGELDYRFLQPENYDSSWKDNLCFLYTGTQVFSLLSIQTEAECFPGWVATGDGRYPLGYTLRRSLRQMALGGREHRLCSDPLSLSYASWANLL